MNDEYDFSAAPETVRDKVQHAVSTARDRAGEVVHRGRETLQARPATSLLTVFAAGVVVGALVAVAARPARRAPLPEIGALSTDRLVRFFSDLADDLREPLERTRSTVTDGAHSVSDAVGRAVTSLRKKGGCW